MIASGVGMYIFTHGKDRKRKGQGLAQWRIRIRKVRVVALLLLFVLLHVSSIHTAFPTKLSIWGPGTPMVRWLLIGWIWTLYLSGSSIECHYSLVLVSGIENLPLRALAVSMVRWCLPRYLCLVSGGRGEKL